MSTWFTGCMAAILFLAFATIASAQSPLCTPDCLESQWQGPFTYSTVMPACFNIGEGAECGCFAEIEYYTRPEACGTYQDLQITAIRTNDLCPANCPETEYLRWATAALILDNPMGFKPRVKGLGECFDNWRISTGGCWYSFYSPRRDQQLIHPCADAACCLARYRVCEQTDLTRQYTLLSSAAQPACQDYPSCKPSCAALDDGIVKFPKLITGEAKDISDAVAVPNPARESVTITAPGVTGPAVLRLYDADGAQTMEIRSMGSGAGAGGAVSFVVVTSGLPSGLYHYEISTPAGARFKGSVTVAR